MNKKLINCGCGMKFSTEWINIDFNSPFECVKNYNLLDGLPFKDGYADFIYHSNLLEHFTQEQAFFFVKECHRVLKSGGIVRTVVPDLEDIAREYLSKVEALRQEPDNKEIAREDDYVKIELLDQMARRSPGGKMEEYWEKNGVTDYVRFRNGNVKERPAQSFRLKRRKVSRETEPGLIHDLLAHSTIFQTYQVGKFELSGEKHLWMYDEYSLCKILKQCGFGAVKVMKWNVSQLPGFDKYELEVDSKGNEYKPHCLYVEAVK